MRPAAVLFDLDGTLVDSAHDNFQALRSAWRDQGANLAFDYYIKNTGFSVSGLAREWSRDHGQVLDGDAAVRAFIQVGVTDAANARLYPDAMGLLDHMHAFCPVGLVTNNYLPIVDALIDAHPAFKVFSTIATADQAGMSPKPAPDLYRAATQALACPADRCVAIEDSDQGIAAAQAAGLQTVDVREFR